MAIKYTDLVQDDTIEIKIKATEVEVMIDDYLKSLEDKRPLALACIDLSDLVEWKGLRLEVIQELCKRYETAGWVLKVGWARNNEMRDYISATLSNKTYRGA